MKHLLTVFLLCSIIFSANAQADKQASMQLKKLIEKSRSINVDEGMYLRFFSNMKIDPTPCGLQYFYSEEWQDEYGEGSKENCMTEIKWANVISVTPQNVTSSLYIKIVSNEKEFTTVTYGPGSPKPDKTIKNIYIPAYFQTPNGSYDAATFEKTLELVKQLTKSCGGRVE